MMLDSRFAGLKKAFCNINKLSVLLISASSNLFLNSAGDVPLIGSVTLKEMADTKSSVDIVMLLDSFPGIAIAN